MIYVIVPMLCALVNVPYFPEPTNVFICGFNIGIALMLFLLRVIWGAKEIKDG